MTTVAPAQAATPYQQLNRARHALRTVATIATPREVICAREIARIATGLLAAFDEHEQVLLSVALAERTTRCLWCSREAPPHRGPRCPTCGGPWYTA